MIPVAITDLSTLARVVFDPDTTPPSVPSNVSVTALSTSALRVTWNASTDTGGSSLAGYRVYRSTTLAGTYTQVGPDLTTASLAYDDTGLSAATTRFYKIAAFDGNSNVSAQSSAASGTTQGTSGAVTPSLTASRLSGPVPLGVFFNARGTTAGSANSFRSLGYSYDFGDSGSGTYTQTGNSKNAHRGGPLAAHVYMSANTFTVKMKARDSSGNTGQTSVSIQAIDADTYYNGLTICVDPSGGSSGGPVGATYVTSMPTVQAGRRYLIRRGQSIPGFTISRTAHISQVGAYGTGNKPVITSRLNISGDSQPSGTPGVWLSGCVIRDLEFRSDVRNYISCENLLMLDCDFLAAANSVDAWVSIGHAMSFYASSPPSGWSSSLHYPFPRAIFSGCRFIGANPYNAGIFGPCAQSAFLDCEFFGVETSSHCLRITNGYEVLVSNCNIRGPGVGSVHGLKVHSGGLNAYSGSFSGADASRYIQVSNCRAGDPNANNAWTFSIRPQSESYTEGIEDVILESVIFDPRGASALEIQTLSRNFVMRGCTRTDGGTVRASFITNASGSGYSSALNAWAGPYTELTTAITTEDPT